MISSPKRQKMEAAGRKREQCWRDLREGIVAYAAAIAPKAAEFGWARPKIAGQKHVPRVALNLASCFDKLLSHQMITVGGKRRPFIDEQTYKRYQAAMLAIGVDIKATYCPVVSVAIVTQAIALFRLTTETQPFHEHDWRARKTKRILSRLNSQWNRINKAEMEAYRAQKAAQLDPQLPTIIPLRPA